MKSLTEKENMLLARALPKNGVVYLEGRPGEAKSSIIRSIAQKTGRKFIDIRLSQMDETDVGLFPDVDKVEKCLNYVVPRWAIEANKQPSIILFDELNRAQLPIRNAALQILLDRKIGWEFEFNDNVLMFSAGNQGEADGCDVEEFDAALWGRLIHVKHCLTLNEWIEGFAKDNVWEVIVSYLLAKPQELYKRNDNTKVYASHRSWTFLSDFIKTSFDGDFSKVNMGKCVSLMNAVGVDYIGSSITGFIRYLEEQSVLNINDVISRYDQVQDQVKSFNRSKMSELLSNLKEFKFEEFNKDQLDNIDKFLHDIHMDETVSYIMYLVDNSEPKEVNDFIRTRFPNVRKIIKEKYKLKD